VRRRPDVVTVGGNDLLIGRGAAEIAANLRLIAERLAALEARVILNTIYDPSDGGGDVARELLGLPAELRPGAGWNLRLATNSSASRRASRRSFCRPSPPSASWTCAAVTTSVACG